MEILGEKSVLDMSESDENAETKPDYLLAMVINLTIYVERLIIRRWRVHDG